MSKLDPRGRLGAALIVGMGLVLAACSEPRGAESTATANAAEAPSGKLPTEDPQASLPPGHPPIGGAAPGAPSAGGAPAAADLAAGMTQGANGLAWQEPPGWRQAPERAMRVATFEAGPAEEPAECYVSEMAGAAGGVEANVARWCQQMGADPLSAAALEALERVRVLGLDAPLVEVPGSYRGMNGEQVPDALLIGTVVPLEGRTLFIKLTGPRALVESERDAFLSFCKSLREES